MDIIYPVLLFMQWCTAYDSSTYVNILSRFVAPKHLFSLRLQWKNLNILLKFSQSETPIFDNLFVKKLMAVSKSGLELFIINNKFAITKWNNSTFLSLSCSEYSLTSNHFLVAGDVTNVLTSSLTHLMYL